ncbi:ionotropic receptor 21a-like [Frieseomelitta varia]|nr:ionotropic receptor 21a-like [Frieseomelitta varia]
MLIFMFMTSVSSAIADKNDIFVSKGKSWIADENFIEIIKSSFTSSRCCNVFLTDWTEDSSAVFDQFKNVYPYDYLLETSMHECQGFFFLGSSDDDIMESIKKIPVLQWDMEILIMVNNNTSSDSCLFNNSAYGIANINIVSVSGMWKLSENYVRPRVFTKIDSYEGMQIKNVPINFQNKELQVCSIFSPPMTYLNHTIQMIINGIEADVYTMDDELDWDGVEMKLFLIIAEKLNFTWTIRKPEGNYTYGQRINDTYWMGGLIQMMREQKIDMAFASIWLTLDQYKFVNLSESWYQIYIHFLVPRPHRTTSFWALSRPFSEEIWYLLLSAFLLHGLYTYIRAWIDPKFPKQYRNFLVALTDLIGYFLSSSVPKTTRKKTNKLQILLWQTAGWLIITAYSSSLAARLASSEYESRIDTLEQFSKANLQWGLARELPPFDDYFDMTNPLSTKLRSRFHYIKNYTQLKQLIRRGNYAILGKVMDDSFVPMGYLSNEDLKNYRLMRQPVGQFYAAFAVQPWLLRPINEIILRLRETGIIIGHLRDVIRRRDSYNLREVTVEHDRYDGSIQVLGLMPLGAGFFLLFVGSLIASMTFYLELRRATDLCPKSFAKYQ